MKVKTSELTDHALDWAVAKCEGILERVELEQVNGCWSVFAPEHECSFEPSTCWTQGGPIIERECLTVSALYAQKNPPSPEYAHGEWGAYIPCGINSEAAGRGPTPLIAAMRCYVASRLGDEVEIPEELV